MTLEHFPPAAPGIDRLVFVAQVACPRWNVTLYGSATVAPGGPRQAHDYPWDPAQPLHVLLGHEQRSNRLRALLGPSETERLNAFLANITSPDLPEPLSMFDRAVVGTVGITGTWTLANSTVDGLVLSLGPWFQAWQYGQCIPHLVAANGPVPSAASDEAERLTRWYVGTLLRKRVGQKPGRKAGQAQALASLTRGEIITRYCELCEIYMDDPECGRRPRQREFAEYFGVSVSTLVRKLEQVGLSWQELVTTSHGSSSF